jgi:hypothetical protein
VTIKKITETVSEFGGEAKDQMEKLGRSAAWTVDEAREQTGEALHEAASSVRSTGVQGSEAIDRLANGTADRLDGAATFVEEHDLKGAITGLRRFGKQHMTGSLVAAAAIGFLAGSALGRATHFCGKRTR